MHNLQNNLPDGNLTTLLVIREKQSICRHTVEENLCFDRVQAK